MNRRTLLKGILGATATLVLPPTVTDAAEEVTRRFWSLDQTHLSPLHPLHNGWVLVSDYGVIGERTDDARVRRALLAAKRFAAAGSTPIGVLFDGGVYDFVETILLDVPGLIYSGGGSFLQRVGEGVVPLIKVAADNVEVRDFSFIARPERAVFVRPDTHVGWNSSPMGPWSGDDQWDARWREL